MSPDGKKTLDVGEQEPYRRKGRSAGKLTGRRAGTGTRAKRRSSFVEEKRSQAARYTRSRRPVRLVYQETHSDPGSALRREAAIKALSRDQKMVLIRKGRRKTS